MWAVKNIFPLDFANSLFRSAKEQESCLCLDRISASREFVMNLLQKRSMGTSLR